MAVLITLNLKTPRKQSAMEDPNLSKKHAMMIERLSNLHQTRVQARQSSSSDSSELTQSFLSNFSTAKLSIESQLAESKLVKDPDAVKSHLESISNSISQLEKSVAESSSFLPSYEVRSSTKTICDLKQWLEKLNHELLPKKKFSFKKSKNKMPLDNVREVVVNNSYSSIDSNTTLMREDHPIVQGDLKSKIVCENDDGRISVWNLDESAGLRNKKNEILVWKFKEDTNRGEFTLAELENCEVRVTGRVRALFVNKLRDCKVYVGPVLGSILIEDVERCVFVLAAHQMRIHCAKGCDFYLRVRSRPIIEDCSGVRFAPYCLDYKGVEEDLKESGLFEETGCWQNVDDFRWLRAVQSPNWSILPEKERVETISIPDADELN